MKTLILSMIATFGLSGIAMASPVDTLEGKLRNMVGGLEIAGSCPSGMNYCEAGSYGPGGCYKLGYANCTAGLVCTSGTQACKPPSGGQAYCYNPSYRKCE
ncbi:hypothetical protein RXV86_12625 [Alisedimentitalea sp. MJ-SS2]|uniref:hypothetical protein n=1 Tax=Aliisedimentitalea sp. MJ-SS2 TaxID=3049795 RepID=UPI002909EA0A|nr:hypothetical protein [Alisedimentitalea sp. MJ-SS2]MDU8928233.1 hypothetical protein [Alisedimentitalea sp. MJ-SS2]